MKITRTISSNVKALTLLREVKEDPIEKVGKLGSQAYHRRDAGAKNHRATEHQSLPGADSSENFPCQRQKNASLPKEAGELINLSCRAEKLLTG